MAPTVTGLGYDWAIDQTGKALRELTNWPGSAGKADRKSGQLLKARSCANRPTHSGSPTQASIALSSTRPTMTTSCTLSLPTSSTSG